jgi:hypothetical protein
MMELSEQNAVQYLRDAGRASPEGEVLVQRLSEADSANVVLKIFDTNAGDKIGSDLRTDGQKKLGKPDTRMTQGACFVVKQPRIREGSAELDQARPRQERACLELLSNLLPAGSVPETLWFDETHHVLGLSCPPPEAVLWFKQIRSGVVSMDAATHAGMLLAMIHSSTRKDPALKERFGDPRLLVQQSVEPMIRAAGQRNPALAKNLQDAVFRLRSPLSLIHGDFRLENILLVPAPPDPEAPVKPGPAGINRGPKLAHVMLVDFESAFFGHNAFDVATLVADLLLAGFLSAGRWRALMMMVDNFWQTYRHTADPELVRAAEVAGGRLLGAMLLGRVDGVAPVRELAERKDLQGRVRGLAQAILKQASITMDEAIDEAPMHFDPPK